MFFALEMASFAVALSLFSVFVSAMTFSLSEVRQCQPINVSFSLADAGPTKPSWILFVPIDGIPTAVNIPSDAASGLSINALPFPVGTSFYVTLQDTFDRPVGNASDVATVLAPLDSSRSSSGCLPVPSARSPSPFLLQDNLQQCHNFTIQYNITLIPTAPSVTLITAKDPGVPLNLTAENRSAGTATYLLAFPRTRHVILLYDAGTANARSSPLITIGGNSTSNRSCLARFVSTTYSNSSSMSIQPTATMAPSVSSSNSSRGIVVASVIAAIVIVIAALAMIFFVFRYIKRRVPRDSRFEPVILDKDQESVPQPQFLDPVQSPNPRPSEILASPPVRRALTPPFESAGSERIVVNPAYTSNRVSFSSSSSGDKTSLSTNRIVQHQRGFTSMSSRYAFHRSSASVASSRPLSVNTLDIEGMLNIASLKSNDSVHAPVPVQPVPSSPFAPVPRAFSPPPATPPRKGNSGRSQALRRYPSRGHLRPPSDVPRGPVSIISSASTEPYSEAGSPVIPAYDLPTFNSRQSSRNVSTDSDSSVPRPMLRQLRAIEPPPPLEESTHSYQSAH